MQEIIFKIRYSERGLSESLKRVNFTFYLNPVPFNGQSYQKQKRSVTGNQSLFELENKFKNILLFVI